MYIFNVRILLYYVLPCYNNVNFTMLYQGAKLVFFPKVESTQTYGDAL